MAACGLYDFDSVKPRSRKIFVTLYGNLLLGTCEVGMNPLILEIIKSIVIPELASFIQNYYTEHNTWPTKEEMEKKAEDLADKIIEQGEAFLNEPNT